MLSNDPFKESSRQDSEIWIAKGKGGSGKKRKHPGSVKKKINEKQGNTVDENANELHSSKEISKTATEFVFGDESRGSIPISSNGDSFGEFKSHAKIKLNNLLVSYNPLLLDDDTGGRADWYLVPLVHGELERDGDLLSRHKHHRERFDVRLVNRTN